MEELYSSARQTVLLQVGEDWTPKTVRKGEKCVLFCYSRCDPACGAPYSFKINMKKGMPLAVASLPHQYDYADG
jgi:hypothetical protein